MAVKDEMGHEASTEGVSVLDGETVLENIHPSYEYWWKTIAFAVIVLLFGLAGGTGGSIIGGLVIAALILGLVYYSRTRSRYVITDERVIQRVGLIRRDTDEMRIEDVQNLRTSRSIFERVLSHGHIEVQTGSATGVMTMSAIRDHERVANLLRERQRSS